MNMGGVVASIPRGLDCEQDKGNTRKYRHGQAMQQLRSSANGLRCRVSHRNSEEQRKSCRLKMALQPTSNIWIILQQDPKVEP
jgi:hypothetical protein